MKTSELTGAALNWAVAKCEEYTIEIRPAGPCGRPVYVLAAPTDREPWVWLPSESWYHGGPIIERERICIDIGHDGVWLAYSKQNYDDNKEFMHSGSTPLIAAMRCFVASRLGEEVEIPGRLA